MTSGKVSSETQVDHFGSEWKMEMTQGCERREQGSIGRLAIEKRAGWKL